jgi:hypothetical protein
MIRLPERCSSLPLESLAQSGDQMNAFPTQSFILTAAATYLRCMTTILVFGHMPVRVSLMERFFDFVRKNDSSSKSTSFDPDEQKV